MKLDLELRASAQSRRRKKIKYCQGGEVVWRAHRAGEIEVTVR